MRMRLDLIDDLLQQHLNLTDTAPVKSDVRVGARFGSVQRNCCARALSLITDIAHELG